MIPALRTFWMISMAVIFFLATSACGQKHLSVSTSSGKANQQEELGASLEDTPSDQTGVQDSNFSETGLGSQFASQGSTVQETIEPIEPIEMGVEPPTLPTIRGRGAEEAPEMAGASISAGSHEGIQPQPHSEDTEDPKNPSAYQTAMDPSIDPFGSAETNQGELMDSPQSERVPEHIVVAKVEPSDAMEEQLARIKEEELATAAAGLQDVFFEFDSWKITHEGRDVLEKNANLLQEDTDKNLLIEGHCDQRGTQAYNIVLGKKRAIAIRDFLVALGVESTRLSVVTYGKEKPFCNDESESCYQENRRGHLIVK